MKLTPHLHLVPRSKNEWSCTSTPPIRLRGVVTFTLITLDTDFLLSAKLGDFIVGLFLCAGKNEKVCESLSPRHGASSD
jgi:hypothetical protein